MSNLIDKSALVAEIKRRINEINIDSIEDWRYRLQLEHDIEVMKNILSFIDTMEVKEVDFQIYVGEELENFLSRHKVYDDLDIAKHFFELGLKAQKGEGV